MAQRKGWIYLHRSLVDHWLWNDKPFSKGQAWVDLLLLANYEDVKIPYKGEVVTCERGVVNRSITFLADRWGWSRKKTTAFLRLLESDEMVTMKATTNRTTITIEKYGFFQDSGTTKGTTEDTTKEQRRNTNNKSNKYKKNNNTSKPNPFNQYPQNLYDFEQLEKEMFVRT